MILLQCMNHLVTFQFSNFQAASQLCGNDTVVGAECRVVGGDGTLTRDMVNPQIFKLGHECTEKGLVCVNTDNIPNQYCLDYEVRYKCLS